LNYKQLICKEEITRGRGAGYTSMSLQYLVHGEYKYPEKYKVEKIL